MTLNVRYREELVVNHADILMAIVVNIIMLWNSRKFKRSRASESKMRQEIGHMLHLNGSRRGIFLGALALYKTYCSFSKYPVWYFQNDFIKKLNILPGSQDTWTCGDCCCLTMCVNQRLPQSATHTEGREAMWWRLRIKMYFKDVTTAAQNRSISSSEDDKLEC